MAPEIRELSRDEIVKLLEDAAQRRLGLSAAELIRAYREGTLEDACSLVDILSLVDLLDDDDPLLVAAA